MRGIYVAISPHGFGHTTRTCSIVAALQELLPQLAVTIVTTAPQWLIDSYLTRPYHYRAVSLDVGVVQSDGLQMDKTATLLKLEELQSNQDRLVTQEAEYVKSQGIGLVFADMPPLAIAIARSVGIPCWVSSNFGWDLIYRDWLAELPQIEPIVDWIQGLYRQTDLLLRLPFCELMPAFPHKIDVGLTGGTPKFSSPEIYQKLQLDPKRSVVLLSFGGLGLQGIPYHNLSRFPQVQFLSFDVCAPQLENLTILSGRNFRPVDVMPVGEAVITKPGYSTIAEACRLGTGVICLTRSGFAEATYLIEGVKNYIPNQIISPEEFYQGDWQFLDRPLIPPRLSDLPELKGEWTIGSKIRDLLSGNF